MNATEPVTLYGPNGQPIRSAAAPGIRRQASHGYGGGVYNPGSGVGGPADKMVSAYFRPTVWNNRRIPMTIYAESWMARAAVDMPVEDMFIRWREWEDEAMKDAEKKRDFKRRLSAALIGGRLYGTAILCMLTQEGGGSHLLEELIPERIREGDLVALPVFNRYDVTVRERFKDPLDGPNYLKPEFYDVYPSYGRGFRIHHSRVVRFDGFRATPTDDSPEPYSHDWGNSILIPILTSVLEDALLTSSIAQLTQEASIAILKVVGLREMLAGTQGEFEMSIEELGQTINQLKSNYRMMMLDGSTEEFQRVSTSFGGMSDLLEKFAARVAAGARIPLTRFLGQSPGGLNATGESDAKNYVATVEAFREAMFDTTQLQVLDMVVARDAGLSDLPEWTWLSMLELSEKEKLEITKTKIEAITGAIDASIITNDEGRETLSGDEFFGALEGPAPEVELPNLDEGADFFAP